MHEKPTVFMFSLKDHYYFITHTLQVDGYNHSLELILFQLVSDDILAVLGNSVLRCVILSNISV